MDGCEASAGTEMSVSSLLTAMGSNRRLFCLFVCFLSEKYCFKILQQKKGQSLNPAWLYNLGEILISLSFIVSNVGDDSTFTKLRG